MILGMFTPVILAGGSGTRLWPLSRQLYPKQFLALSGDKTMFQLTIERLNGIECERAIVICNEEHRFIVAEQMRQLGIDGGSILLEPMAKNTAPAIALAALKALEKDETSVILVMPADHYISDVQSFHFSIKRAMEATKEGYLVTFGVNPTKPETGYGYIKRGGEKNAGIYAVENFVEKPDEETAIKYLYDGNYYWNSGMFMFKAKTYLEELKKFEPEILECCQRAFQKSSKDLDFFRMDVEAFNECPSSSIDYAVMEKTDKSVVVPLDAGWSDIGSWSSLWELYPKDEDNNCLIGDVMAKNTTGCLVHSENRLVVTLGVEDLIVVDTKDVVLVMNKDNAQDMKSVVERLKIDSRIEHINHRQVYRPWGTYDTIGRGERYQVKRIIVKPGGKLSLQLHHHRAEHWIVVNGTARVTLEDRSFLLSENESTFIPLGKAHSLENPGKIPLELIEVQSGSYLGEDDIVRLRDEYGRS